jgi:hypothetical protein
MLPRITETMAPSVDKSEKLVCVYVPTFGKQGEDKYHCFLVVAFFKRTENFLLSPKIQKQRKWTKNKEGKENKNMDVHFLGFSLSLSLTYEALVFEEDISRRHWGLIFPRVSLLQRRI